MDNQIRLYSSDSFTGINRIIFEYCYFPRKFNDELLDVTLQIKIDLDRNGCTDKWCGGVQGWLPPWESDMMTRCFKDSSRSKLIWKYTDAWACRSHLRERLDKSWENYGRKHNRKTNKCYIEW